MKKNVLLVLIIVISIFSFDVRAEEQETIIDSQYVTYENDKTLKKNVRGALDELIDKVDTINAGGDANNYEIAKGKTAYVNGSEITGTHEDRPFYFKVNNNWEGAWFDGYELSCAETDTVLAREFKGVQTTLKKFGANDSNSFCHVVQISPSVAMMNYGWTTTSGVTSTHTDTNDTEISTVSNYNYIATFLWNGTTLTAVKTVAGGIGNNDATNYGWYLNDYTNYVTKRNTNWDTTTDTAQSRSVYSEIKPSIFQNYLSPYTYFTVTGTVSESYTNYLADSGDWTKSGIWYKTIGINNYTGAITESPITTANVQQIDNANWSDVYEWDFTNFGVCRSTYSSKAHENMPTSYLYHDFYGTTRVNTVTSTGADNASLSRDLKNVFRGQYYYGMSLYVTPSDKNITFNVYSSSMGSPTVAAAYFVANPNYRQESLTVDFSSYLYPDINITNKSIKLYYSDINQEYYLIFNTSDDGKFYVIVGIDDKDFTTGSGLRPYIKSAGYKKTDDGKFVSTARLLTNNENITNISFYK